MTRPLTRIPVKLHRNVALIRTAEPVLAEELLARKSLARWVLGRLSETVLLVRPDEAEAVIDELRRMGHTPRWCCVEGIYLADGHRIAADAAAEPRPTSRAWRIRSALARYKGSRLAAIRLAQGLMPAEDRIRPAGTAEEITEHLDQPAAVEALAARLPIGSRLALSLFAVTEATAMPAAGLAHALGILGADPVAAIVRLLELGLLAIEPNAELGPVDDFAAAMDALGPARVQVRVHPSVLRAIRAVRPEGRLPAVEGPIGQVRESDGLEPILRLGASGSGPAPSRSGRPSRGRCTSAIASGSTEDPVLAGPIADAMAPLPDPAAFWLALARRIGVVERDASGQRLLAAPTDFWADNAVHLPQMIATGWLSLRAWQEPTGSAAPADAEPDADEPALPYLRPAVLLWLATLGEAEWVALDDLAGHLAAHVAGLGPPDDRPGATGAPPTTARRARTRPSLRVAAGRRAAGPARRPSRRAARACWSRSCWARPIRSAWSARPRSGGPGAAWCSSPRWGATSWRPARRPPPRPTFEQFLFVQPNFEVIAYRQGLTPQLVGRLSRFAWWTQIGAAMELRLTRESIVLGLDGGLTPESMLEVLTRHSQRAAARRRGRRGPDLGHAPRAGDLLRGGDADRVRLGAPSGTRRWSPGRGTRPTGSRAADRRRRSVPAGRRRADDPVRPVPAWPARETTDARRKPA